MEAKLKEKLLATKGCGTCTVSFAEGIVQLCDTRNKGPECKEQSIDTIVELLDGNINNDEFLVRIRGIFGEGSKRPVSSESLSKPDIVAEE